MEKSGSSEEGSMLEESRGCSSSLVVVFVDPISRSWKLRYNLAALVIGLIP